MTLYRAKNSIRYDIFGNIFIAGAGVICNEQQAISDARWHNCNTSWHVCHYVTASNISGRLGVVQGYLVYIFKLANFDAETSHIVIIDAGNGAVLHISGDMPLFFGGLGCGGGFGGHHHKGFENQWGSHDNRSGGERSDRTNNGGQPFSSGVVVSPTIGV
jgi:hypothetical protein